MSYSINPCPHCGGTNLHVADMKSEHHVMCLNEACWMEGPKAKSKKEAIKAWNNLSGIVVWKNEPPSAPGWYFFQRICPYAQKHYPLRVVHIHYDECMGKRVLCYGGSAWYGVEDERQDSFPVCDISKSDLQEMWWAGPIIEPVKRSDECQKN